MYTYGTLLTLILMSLIGIAITVYLYRTDARDVITKTMAESLKNYKRGEHEGVTLTWDKIQKEFECCGVNNFTDWEGTPAFNETNDVPDFCCKTIKLHCGKGASDTDKIYKTGCFVKFESFVVDNVATVGGVGVGVIILLFLGICVSCHVARRLASKRSHGRLL